MKIIKTLFVFPVILWACEPPAIADNRNEQGHHSETLIKPETNIRYVDADQAHKMLISDSSIKVIDVRTPQEFEAGHIEGAQLINFKSTNFADELATLNKNENYIVHCQSGGRSSKSLQVFTDLGFENIIHMDGGIGSWKRSGLPLIK